VIVSVVIPTLNEAAQIEATLASVLEQPGPVEVIVVDSGSMDDTVARAQAHARVLDAPRGRARQMNAGAAQATGDVLLFLHADTHLPEGALDVVRSALAEPAIAAGCFRTTFDAEGFWMRLWSLRLWMRWHRLAFGDRAPFVRREAFEAIGGFPEQPIFEDLELVRRLRRQGRFVFLDEAVITSARRYQRHGAVAQQLRNLALWSAWNLRLPPLWFKRFYPDAPGERS
jgi:rSAM/selenodomain-associated transferase 2